MISFKTFLNEQQQRTYTFEEGLEAIKDHCSWFINESAGKPMFRGIPKKRVIAGKLENINTTKISWTPHPSDRKPKDSDPAFNFIMNSMIDAGFGIENIRRKSFFATGNKAQAIVYGEVMFCLPKGKPKWMWSPDISDAYEESSELYDRLIKASGLPDFTRQIYKSIFEKLCLSYGQSTRTWVNNENGDSERVTLSIAKDAMEHFEDIFAGASPYKILLSGLRDTAKDLYIDTKSLAAAITSGNEIMFYESDGYYLVPEETVAEEASRDGVDVKNSTDARSSQKLYEYLLSKLR